MTIADLSVILAKVQVDETDVVRLSPGDSVAVTIDAFPDTTFVGRVTKISNSAKLTADRGPAAATTTAPWTSTSRSRSQSRRATSAPT